MSDYENAETQETENSNGKEAEAFTTDDIKKRYFDPAQLGAAAVYVDQIESVFDNSRIERNYDPNEEGSVPAGFGILIQPISTRVNGSQVLDKVAISAVPSLEIVAGDEKGAAFLWDAALAAFGTKISNAVRNESDTLPLSLSDFVERKRDDSLATFREQAPALVKALKKMGAKTLTAMQLRQIFSNAAIAKSQYPSVEQSVWVNVMQAAIKKAESEGLDASIYRRWIAQRDEAEMTDVHLEIDDDFLDALA